MIEIPDGPESKEKQTKRWKLLLVFGLAVVALMLVTLYILLNNSADKKEVPQVSVQTAGVQAQVVVELKPTIQERLDAAGRSEEGAEKICYDAGRDGYFVLYRAADMKYSGTDPDKGWNGWFYTNKIKLFRIEANNSWFATMTELNSYTTVYPDVTGLPCKVLGGRQ